jgi:prepilin-type processing-associated H-X9-DG protein
LRRPWRLFALECGAASHFTLIELLVVVAIIMLLMSILLPSLQSARGKAKQMSCANNLRQLNYALLSYSTDRGDYLAPSFNGLQDWTQILIADNYLPFYLTRQKAVSGVMHCPSTARGYTDFRTVNGQTCYTYLSYAMNSNLAGYLSAGYFYGNPSRGMLMLTGVAKPSSTIWQCDAGPMDSWGLYPGPGGIPRCRWEFNNASISVGFTVSETDSGSSGFAAGRHSNGANISFVDGHIGYLKYGTYMASSGICQRITGDY